jgi:hypothetical protein
MAAKASVVKPSTLRVGNIAPEAKVYARKFGRGVGAANLFVDGKCAL